MRKSLLVTLALTTLIMVSCSDNDPQDLLVNNTTQKTMSKHRTVSDAIDIANRLRKDKSSRAWNPISSDNVSVIQANHNGRSSDNDTLLYIVDYGNNEGFTIVSSSYEGEPILAMIEQGNYQSVETSENQAFQNILDASINYVGALTLDTLRVPFMQITELPRPDTLFYDTVRTKRLDVAWGQYWPENMYCPNKVAGCGPLAIAQICSFVEKPDTLDLDFPERDKSSINLDWSQIKHHIRSNFDETPDDLTILYHYYACETSTENHKNIARLIRQIGKDCNASYRAGATGVTWSAAKGILSKYVMPHLYTELTSSSMLYNYLLQYNGVAMICGGDHIWVVDGILFFGYRVTEYYYPTIDDVNYSTTPIGGYASITTNYTSSFFHMNLGWGGNCNGYYNSVVFKPNIAYEYDYTENNTSHSYNDGFEYCFVRKI